MTMLDLIEQLRLAKTDRCRMIVYYKLIDFILKKEKECVPNTKKIMKT